MRLLLISNSTMPGGGYLDHCAAAILSVLDAGMTRVLFVPYAVSDHGQYVAKVRARFELMGLALDSVHDAAIGAVRAVEEASALFVGGGNTFRLLDALWQQGLIDPIRERARAGMPYVGVSAGTNVACPTIGTTNDMPIVEPPTLGALGLVSFNINPHFQDAVAGSTHMGETREQRIAEFHEEHARPVVGLREGAWLIVDGSSVRLEGTNGARLFRRGMAPVELAVGEPVSAALGPPAA